MGIGHRGGEPALAEPHNLFVFSTHQHRCHTAGRNTSRSGKHKRGPSWQQLALQDASNEVLEEIKELEQRRDQLRGDHGHFTAKPWPQPPRQRLSGLPARALVDRRSVEQLELVPETAVQPCWINSSNRRPPKQRGGASPRGRWCQRPLCWETSLIGERLDAFAITLISMPMPEVAQPRSKRPRR